MENKDEFAKQQFEKYYPIWKSLRENKPDDKASQDYALRSMIRSGVPTLPYLMDVIEKGDESLIPIVSKLTHKERCRFGTKDLLIKSTATRSECLTWWGKNKEKWRILDHNKENPKDTSGSR